MEKEIKKTREDILIQYWNGHLSEFIRLKILIGLSEKRDPAKLEEYKKQLEDQEIYLKVITKQLENESS